MCVFVVIVCEGFRMFETLRKVMIVLIGNEIRENETSPPIFSFKLYIQCSMYVCTGY